jgi:predicted nucleic acid-binding Zn ribbon protein
MSDEDAVADAARASGAASGAASGIDLARSLLAAARASAAADRPTRTSAQRQAARRRSTREANLTRSGSTPDDRDPQLLGATVERLVTDRGWEVPVAVGGVIGRWADVVGPDVADHCQPESFDDTVVTVRAESTAWATQVRMLAPMLVRRLNEELGDGTVTRVQVLGPSGPSWRKGRWRVAGRGPRDTYG